MPLYEREKPDFSRQERYDMLRTKRYSIKLNRGTDAGIISFLDKQKSVQGTIRQSLKFYMEEEERMELLDERLRRMETTQDFNHKLFARIASLHRKAEEALSELNFQEHKKIMDEIGKLQEQYKPYE